MTIVAKVVKTLVAALVMFFTPKQVQELFGISYRQIQYWDRTGLVSPDRKKGRGKMRYRKYSFREIIDLDLIKTLRPSEFDPNKKKLSKQERKKQRITEFSIQKIRDLLPRINDTLASRPKGEGHSVVTYSVLVEKNFTSEHPIIIVGQNLRLDKVDYSKFFVWHGPDLLQRITGEQAPPKA